MNHPQHVSDDQPYIHLFSVPLDEVKRRVSNGSKWADKPKHKSELAVKR